MVIISAVGFLVSGCGFSENIEEAKIVAESYFKSFESKDPEKIRAFLSPEMLENADSTEYADKFIKLHERLGEYRSLELLGWNVTNQIGVGTFITIQFQVTYANYSAMETLVFVRSDLNDSLKVYGHKISSEAFFDDI
jgi:hypothetical protein